MSETQEPKGSQLLTFLGSLGAILIFALILFVAYLPNRAGPVDEQTNADRQAKADEIRAAGTSKITSFEVIDAASGKVRIPVEDAIEIIVDSYGTSQPAEPEAAPEAKEAEAN